MRFILTVQILRGGSMGALDDFPQMQAVQAASATGLGLAVSLPVISREAFAFASGISAATVYSMCDRGYLPTVHFGRRVFINLEVLRSQCAAKELT